jgi:hypothetical protein
VTSFTKQETLAGGSVGESLALVPREDCFESVLVGALVRMQQCGIKAPVSMGQSRVTKGLSIDKAALVVVGPE